MSYTEQDRQDQRQLSAGQAEILRRMAAAERRWEEGEAARVGEWEALEGRMMTAEEKRKTFDDALFRKMTIMTDEHSLIIQQMIEQLEASREKILEKIADEHTEGRAEARAGREALLRILDRLPPPRDPS